MTDLILVVESSAKRRNRSTWGYWTSWAPWDTGKFMLRLCSSDVARASWEKKTGMVSKPPRCLLLLPRIRSAHLEILRFPMGGAY